MQDAILEVTRFWLDRGVDGFRLDALNFSMHDPELRDNPPSHVPIEDVTRPFDMQIKRFNQSHADIPAFIERIRAVIDEYPGRFTVAEVGGPTPLEEMKAFTAGDTRLNSAYNFDFLYAPQLTAARVKASLANWTNDPEEGWPSWAFSNHDAPRYTTRWADSRGTEHTARLATLLLLALRGNPIIYQGEELGLPQGHVPFEDLQDPEAIANWPHTLGRDGARTPLPWCSKSPQAGFSTANATWLKVDPAHADLAIEQQSSDPGSMVEFTRQLLAQRAALPALVTGNSELLDTPDDVVAFVRSCDGEDVLCVFNLGEETVDWNPPSRFAEGTVIANEQGAAHNSRSVTVLPPRSGAWIIRGKA